VVTIGATTPTGFEFVAVRELKAKLDIIEMERIQGKIFFRTTISCLPRIHQLKSIDNLFIVVKYFPEYVYNEDKETAIKDIMKLPVGLPWEKVVEFWRENQKYCRKQKKKFKKSRGRAACKDIASDNSTKGGMDQTETLNGDPKASIDDNTNGVAELSLDTETVDEDGSVDNKGASADDDVFSFRVTANRVGKKQSITSPDAERHFGGVVNDVTHWKVDLSNYVFEVLVTLGVDNLMVCVSLTNMSLHHRNITHFGITTLRSTIAYNMVMMCDVQPGDVVIDPMCGCGSIPIEGSSDWKSSFFLAGDNAHPAVVRAISNVNFLNKQSVNHLVDVLKWDCTNLPLKTASIDVFVTDLPFGKRVGTRTDNRELYPSILRELARVSRPVTARACLLTYDKRSIVKAIASVSHLWKIRHSMFINIGGLKAVVHLLRRTANPVLSTVESEEIKA